MLLLRLQRLQEREAKVDTISDPKEREAARAEIEAERAELNTEFESVNANASKFKLPKFNLEPFKFKFGWGSDKDEKTTEAEPKKQEKEKKAKKSKDSSKKKLFGGFKLGFSGSADDDDQALPEIDPDVVALPALELRNKVREDIDKLDKEKDPAEAESRIKVIISMLLLRLQGLQEREAKLDSISNPAEREAAEAEIEAERAELNADFESVEAKASGFKFKLPKFSLEPFKIQFGWGRKSEDKVKDDDEPEKDEKKTKKSRESPVKKLFEGIKLGFSSSADDDDQALPEIDPDVVALPALELRNKVREDIDKLDKEK